MKPKTRIACGEICVVTAWAVAGGGRGDGPDGWLDSVEDLPMTSGLVDRGDDEREQGFQIVWVAVWHLGGDELLEVI